MKKKNLVATLAVIACATSMGAALVACDNADDPQNPQSYTIVFDTNGGSIVSEQGVTGGDKIIEPGDPTKFGYEFDGWYTDEECTQIWTFETDTVTGNLTLYAKWKDKSATANTYFDFGLSNGAYSIKVKTGQTLPADVILPSEYEGKPVTAIADGAFEGQTTLKSVKIPSSVKSIGARAFRNCASLETVLGADNVESIGGTAFGGTKYDDTLQSGATYIGKTLYKYTGAGAELAVRDGTVGIAVSAAQDNTSLTKLTLPSTLKTIGNYAFGTSGDKSGMGITELVIPDGVESIGDNAFRNAKSLAKLVVGKGVKSIGANAFYGAAITDLSYGANAEIKDNSFAEVAADAKITIGDAVKAFPAGIVGKYASLTEVTLGAGVTQLPANAFNGQAKLAKLTVNGALTVIGASALQGTAITEFTVGKTVVSIGANAFKDCAALKKVTYDAKSATAPATSAFAGCAALKTVVVGDNAEAIPDSLFAGVALTSLTLGDNVAVIGADAFRGAAITSVAIGEKVTEIGADAFGDNDALATVAFNAIAAQNKSDCTLFPNAASLTIGAKVTEIPAYMANGNTALTALTLPATVTDIGSHAFDGCTALATINGFDNVKNIGADALKDTPYLAAYLQADGVVYLGSILYAYNGDMPQNYTLEVKAGTTTIAEGALAGQNNLVAVKLPDSVVEIGARAFKDCKSLKGTVDLSSVIKVGDEAFSGDDAIEKFAMNGKLEEVGAHAFDGCKIAEIALVMPETAKSLGEYAFYDCYGLKSIDIKGGITEIPAYCFYIKLDFDDDRTLGMVKSIKLAPSVERVRDYWVGMNSVEHLEIPGVKYIGKNALAYYNYDFDVEQFLEIPDGAFLHWGACERFIVNENCTILGACFKGSTRKSNLKYVEIKSRHINEIASNMFAGQSTLTKVVLPDSITSFGSRAFLDCTNAVIYGGLTSNVKSIGEMAFCNVRGFGTPVDLSGVTSFGNSAFDNSRLSGEIVLNAELERVNQYCFQNTNITKITVSGDFTSFWDTGCFGGCTSLREVELKEGVTKMYAKQFDSLWNGIATLVLPSTITEIPAGSATKFKAVKLNSYVAPTTLALSQTASQSAFSKTAYFICKDAATLAQYAADGSVWKAAAGADWETVWQPQFSVGDASGWLLKDGALVLYFGDRANIMIPQALTEMPALSSLLGTSAGALSEVTFTVDAGNTLFKVKDGALMNADETIVYAFNTASDIASFSSETVAEVKPYAFAYARNLKTVNLSALVTLGEYAFAGSGLTSISLNVNVSSNAFIDCASLETVELGASCTQIAGYAFAYSGVKSITMAAVQSIGEYAFACCMEYKNVVLPETCEIIGGYAFDNAGVETVNLEHVKKVYVYAFQRTPLKSVSLDSATEIRSQAFYDCKSLATVRIGAACTSIASKAFLNINANATVIFEAETPPSVTTPFGSYLEATGIKVFVPYSARDAYLNNASYDNYRVQANPETVENTVKIDDWYLTTDGAFVAYVGDRSNISIPKELKSGLTDISLVAGRAAASYKNVVISVAADSTSFKLQNGMLTSYDGKTAYAVTADAAAQLVLDGVEEVLPFAFYANKSVMSVAMPDAVTIGKKAFYNSNVIAVNIGANCTSVGEYALSNEAAKMYVTLSATTPPTVLDGTFVGSTKFAGKIFVPQEAMDTYKTSPVWSTFAANMYVKPEQDREIVELGNWLMWSDGEFIDYTGEFTFDGTEVLTLPKELTTLPDSLAVSIFKLTATNANQTKVSFAVEEGNVAFKIKDGVLMSADEKTVYGCNRAEVKGKSLTLAAETIMGYALYSAEITSVELPNAVTIGDRAFYKIPTLTSVKIGDKCTTFGTYVFNGCNATMTFTIETETPPTIGMSTFGTATAFKGKIYVPTASVDTYKVAKNWKTYAKVIEAIPAAE